MDAKVSIQDLKRSLSQWISRAESGDTVRITRHAATVARLVPPEDPQVRTGKNFGHAKLAPLFHGETTGRGLQTLLEDRYGDVDGR